MQRKRSGSRTRFSEVTDWICHMLLGWILSPGELGSPGPGMLLSHNSYYGAQIVGATLPKLPAAIARSLMFTTPSSLISTASSAPQTPPADPMARPVAPQLVELVIRLMSRIFATPSMFTSPPYNLEGPMLAGFIT